MATTFNGNGSIPSVTSATTRAVPLNYATNASPIHCNTVAPHGFNTGDTIEIQGEGGNTAANGVWQITVQDANNFLLNGSTGNGADTGGGYAIDYEVQPAFQLPAPGDPASIVTMGPIVEGLSNAIPFLNRRCGKLRLVNQFFGLFNTSNAYPAWSTSGTVAPNQFALMPSSTHTAQALSDTPATAPYFSANDWIDIHVMCGAYGVSTSGSIYLSIGASIVQSGSSVAFGGGGLFSSVTSPANALIYPVSARILVTPGVITSGLPVSFAVGMQSASFGATSTSVSLIGPYTIVAYQYRGN